MLAILFAVLNRDYEVPVLKQMAYLFSM